MHAGKSTARPIPVGGSRPTQCLSSPAASAHQPSQPPAPSIDEGRRIARSPTSAAAARSAACRRSCVGSDREPGRRSECTVSVSTAQRRRVGPGLRVSSAPSAAKLNPAPSAEAAPRDRRRGAVPPNASLTPSDRNQRLVSTSAEAVRSHDQLDAGLARLRSVSSGAEVARRSARCRRAARCTRSGSLDPSIDVALVDRDRGSARGEPGRGSMAAFQLPVPPS